MRCLHESELHSENCFITLTYDDKHLPSDRSLPVYQGGDFQLFMKRLRKANSGKTIRFFSCGEYGEKLDRPHYHACLFGFDFKDKYLWSSRNGFSLFRSSELDVLWGKGHALIGEVTFESAAYVARYIMKKITGDGANEHYNGRRPEYTTMSRRPGIGKAWFDRYRSDVYPSDFLLLRGVKVRPPKFYDALLEGLDKAAFDSVKSRRVANARLVSQDNDSFRLPVKEFIKKSRVKNLIRSLEGDI